MCDEHDVKTHRSGRKTGNIMKHCYDTQNEQNSPEEFWTPGAFSEVENAEPPHSESRALGIVLILSIMFWCAAAAAIVLLNY